MIKFRYVYSNGKEIKSFIYTIEEVEYIIRPEWNILIEDTNFKLISRDRFTGWKNIFENDIVTAPYMLKELPVIYSNTLAKFTIGGKFYFTALDENLRVVSNTHIEELKENKNV
jgi:hypothetical protein